MALAVGGCSRPSVNFTGIWKGNCADFFGVQIRAQEARERPTSGLYRVTFCGLSGCVAPGEWMPDSRIEGDPLYQVVSASTIRIKRNDAGYFTYHKCTASSFWATTGYMN